MWGVRLRGGWCVHYFFIPFLLNPHCFKHKVTYGNTDVRLNGRLERLYLDFGCVPGDDVIGGGGAGDIRVFGRDEFAIDHMYNATMITSSNKKRTIAVALVGCFEHLCQHICFLYLCKNCSKVVRLSSYSSPGIAMGQLHYEEVGIQGSYEGTSFEGGGRLLLRISSSVFLAAEPPKTQEKEIQMT